MGLNYQAEPVSYEKNENIIALQWNIYEQYKDLTGEIVNGFLGTDIQTDIFIGYFKRTFELVNEDLEKFDTDFDFTFVNANAFAFKSEESSFSIETGDNFTRFDLAA